MNITNLSKSELINLINEASSKGWSAVIRKGYLYFYSVRG